MSTPLSASMEGTPDALRHWILSFGSCPFPVPESEILHAAQRALGEALERAPEDRTAAWALLAADALLTWGVEAAADAEVPTEALALVLERVTEEAGGLTD